MSFRVSPRKLIALAMLAVVTMAAAPAASLPQREQSEASDLERAAAAAAKIAPATSSAPRAAIPEDRYAMAGGCYALRSAATGGYVRRADGAVTATAQTRGKAEPFHFQATDLGEYLLYDNARDFLGASDGESSKAVRKATGTAAGSTARGLTGHRTDPAAGQLTAGPAATSTGRGARVEMLNRPRALADWRVEPAKDGTFRFTLPAVDRVLRVYNAGALTLAATGTGGQRSRFGLELKRGCAKWPEVQVNVRGPVAVGETPYGEVRGYNDAHLHSMAFEFLGGRARCGRPWHRYGVTHALRGCREHEIAGGRAAVLENFLAGRDMAAGHDTNSGWPTFKDWPKPEALTYEQVYYKWLERAWRGGLRMYTNLLVDNNQLCKLYPYKKHGCNEMDGVRLQYKRIHQFQDYIDAQSGGPGEGWFRIVKDPLEARRVMNAGKLAVVLGIEVSVLFDCGTFRGASACSKEQVDQRLDEVYDMGIRQMELVNKFDNALSGVTGDAAAFGVLVNNANFWETGSFWPMKTCEDEQTHAHDKPQYNVHDESGAPDELSGRDSLVGILLQELGGSGAAPVYGPGPHCSQLGLSPLGEHLIRRMMDKGMIFDPDHMSAKARAEAMDIIEAANYSGVISSHSWADDTIYPRIWKVGGVVTPHAGSSTSFVEKWRQQKAWSDDRYLFGLGYGSDMNGFSNQGQERGADAPNPVKYPFKGLGGVTVDKQVSGRKTFDFNVDGVAHIGMYPDFIEDVRNLGGADGDQIVADMQLGAEAFLQMWERGVGIPPNACRPDVADLSSTAGIEEGMTPEQVLLVAGQPASRTGNSKSTRRGEVILSQDEAWDFMTSAGQVLLAAGFDVRVPPLSRRKPTPMLRLTSSEAQESVVGAQQLTTVRWSAVFDDVELSAQDIMRLASEARPLVKARGKWIELDHADLAAAAAALAERADKTRLTGAEMLRSALGLDGSALGGGIDVAGEGWAADLLRSASEIAEERPTQPEGFSGELRSYQADALSWLRFLDSAGLGGCLALDMGLGKTPTMLAHLLTATEHGPALVVAPPAVVGNWAAEAHKFVPTLRVLVHHGSTRAEHEEIAAEVSRADVIITTYGTAVRDIDALEDIEWGTVVLDEAQVIKNPTSDTAQQLRRLNARTRVALTGTPIENGLGDLWAILDFTNPGLVGDRASFVAQLSRSGGGRTAAEAALRTLNGVLVFRRTKAEPAIAAELPDRIDVLDHCPMTPEQIGLYQAVLDTLVAQTADDDSPPKKGAVLAAITALKQICNHPAAYNDDDGPLDGRSGKLARLDEIVDNVFEADERVLIFTHFAQWGEKLATYLTKRTGKPIACYHGGLARGARDRLVTEFQAGKGAGALVLSLKAGGTGLNLTAASHVVLYDRWWNPAVEDQARDRAWRIGQKNKVVAHRLVCPGTVDERVEEVVAGKRRIADLVLPASSSVDDLRGDQLRAALGIDPEAVLADETFQPTTSEGAAA